MNQHIEKLSNWCDSRGLVFCWIPGCNDRANQFAHMLSHQYACLGDSVRSHPLLVMPVCSSKHNDMVLVDKSSAIRDRLVKAVHLSRHAELDDPDFWKQWKYRQWEHIGEMVSTLPDKYNSVKQRIAFRDGILNWLKDFEKEVAA